MNVRLMKENELETFITETQKAFQNGYERYFGKCNETIISREDILASYNTLGSRCYVVDKDNEIIAGAIVVINEETNINDLHILFTKVGLESKGIGFTLWETIEGLYPKTIAWHTCTPYFDERNINFYVNKCHFHIVEFFNKYHPDPNMSEDFIGDAGEGMFEFEKVMK